MLPFLKISCISSTIHYAQLLRKTGYTTFGKLIKTTSVYTTFMITQISETQLHQRRNNKLLRKEV